MLTRRPTASCPSCPERGRWTRRALLVGLVYSLCSLLTLNPTAAVARQNPPADAAAFLDLLFGNKTERRRAIKRISNRWQSGHSAVLIETLRFSPDSEVNGFVLAQLQANTGQDIGYDTAAWYQWLWSKPPDAPRDYAEFKSQLYRRIDPAFEAYFANERRITIRLDEVVWGGVRQDGIPPLRSPRMIAAEEAIYLDDDNVVFGISVNGDVRAYPKRILAWHEMFIDEVGQTPVAGVYCTLCGTAILYKTSHDGVLHELGTSGFLYRSNKLMYDRATQSLWNTIWGKPVIGPLVGRSIELERLPIVTTTWGEWRRRHPLTKVLSIDTGYRRNYAEGEAYRDYFATDELMFGVPKLDRRLRNKDEVLTLVSEDGETAIAIAAHFLAATPIYHDQVGATLFVVLTDRSGANRVYEAQGVRFVAWDQDHEARDTNGVVWTVEEDALLSSGGARKSRLAAQRAFWFGWYAAYPDTRLVHE